MIVKFDDFEKKPEKYLSFRFFLFYGPNYGKVCDCANLIKSFKNVKQDYEVVNFFADEIKKDDLIDAVTYLTSSSVTGFASGLPSKVVYNVTGSHPASNALKISSANFGLGSYENSKTHIFFNGLLMTSGSSYDYTLEGTDTGVIFNFALKNKEVVMGFGHRVYKSGDSRVPTMREYFGKVAKIKKDKKFEKIYDIVEKVMIKEKNIYPNVDYPTGPTYHLMGFDTDFFTPIFVISRITGWSAHIMEQHTANKLIRPLASYKGNKHRKVMQLNQR